MEKENEKIQGKAIETYAEDMAKLIGDDKQGLIKKIIQGEEESEKEKRNLSLESRKNKFFIYAGVFLVLAGIGIFSYFILNKDIATVPIEDQFTPLIFNDKNFFINIQGLKKDEIAKAVSAEVKGTSVKAGGVEAIYLSSNKKVIGLKEFIAATESNLNLATQNNLDFVRDNFLMGVVNNETKDFFMLLKVRIPADMFEALRAWENKIFSDLHGFFGLDISAETKYLLTAELKDGIIENKNAKILYDKEGNIVLMYVFADEDSVIITNTVAATREIMLRLASGQVKK